MSPQGCFIGTIVSLAAMFFIGVGYQVAKFHGLVASYAKETSIAECLVHVNETAPKPPTEWVTKNALLNKKYNLFTPFINIKEIT